MKSLFGIDMDLNGHADEFDDFLFMHAIDEDEKRRKKEDKLGWIDELDEMEDIEDEGW